MQIPVEHWKVVIYRIKDQTRFRCFVLSQDLSGLGFLDGFATYQVDPDFLRQRSLIEFPGGLAGSTETPHQAARRPVGPLLYG